jgi:hypothetical protein
LYLSSKYLEAYWIGFIQISLTKPECPVCQTGLSGFGSSNSAASFVKYQNCLFTPPLGDIKGLSNTIQSFLMIAHIICGHFLCV